MLAKRYLVFGMSRETAMPSGFPNSSLTENCAQMFVTLSVVVSVYNPGQNIDVLLRSVSIKTGFPITELDVVPLIGWEWRLENHRCAETRYPHAKPPVTSPESQRIR